MALTLEQYATYLDTRQDLSWPAAVAIERPKAKPHLVRLRGIRAVTWSVYGTLLSLAGGELYFEHPQQFIMDVALDKTIQEFKMWGSMSRKPGQPADYLGKIYANVLSEHKLALVPGEKHPEIASDRIWEAIVKKLLQKDYKFDASFFGSLNEFSRKVAYFFHASLQGTEAYPGAADALAHVARSGLAQGLLADAQCFTTAQLQRCLGRQDGSLRLNDLVDPTLHALSFEQRVRKPSERLFRHMSALLAARAITPDQVLHVGSRIAQDVVPAKRLGMKTALFAGDKASLQATANQLKEPATKPDVMLTKLKQIVDVVG
jgi:FMN phosphatase YigB (HAD superfamily)